MSGLERIVNEILSSVRAEADAILSDARAQAGQILAGCEKDRAQAAALAQREALEKVSEIEAAARAEIELKLRHGILETKQSLLTQTLDSALEALRGLPEGEYFELLIKIAASNAEKGEGVLFLGSGDLARVPKDFGERLAAVLPPGSTLFVSGASADIDGGCILQYGNVDKNCSFKAIFDARRDEFTDKVCEILFA